MRKFTNLIWPLLLMSFCVVPAQSGTMPVNKGEINPVHQDPLASGGKGPKIIQVPAGRFMMGSPEDESGRYEDEGPQHLVTFRKPFYLGLTEVTVGQFRRFVEATDYITDAEKDTGTFIRLDSHPDGGWKLRTDINWRMDHEGKPSIENNPVVHVSWNDAQAYLVWLSGETGKKYRLPSEAELEYANRAGSNGSFWWGEGSPRDNLVNIRGEKDQAVANPKTWEFLQREVEYTFAEGEVSMTFDHYGDGFHGLAPVGSFSPNPFGLHDTAGNVWEWVEDCWHENYVGAPTDGSAWVEGGDCYRGVVRGGSYYCFPRHVRSANRWVNWREMRVMYIGFRVARDF